MRIDLSEEQTFFQETVRRFVETETPVSRVREIAETPDGFDHDWWRQASCLGGGSTEMARNIISERILRMPREYAADRDTAFSDVRRSRNV
jgi:hypothetical protein|tara:strand:- start:127 stop:399 length:273 start_codon:yes stop_codon:yes gene_type:complete